MNLRRFSVLLALVSLAALLMPLQIGQAQEETCEQFPPRVLSDLGLNCANLGDNSACFGFDTVEALFQVVGPTFGEAGDQAELPPIARLKAFPFNLAESVWGMGLINVNAYVSTQEDGTVELARVVYLLVGDVELEQAGEPAFDSNGALIIDQDHLAPMQNAYLRNGFDKPGCAQVPDPLLLVQSPQDKAVRIKVNGADVELGSTVLFKNITPVGGIAQNMRMIVLNGLATVDPDGTALMVPPGHYVDFCLGVPQNLGLDQEENDQVVSCPPSDPLPLTQLDLDALQLLQNLPGNILHNPVDVPDVTWPSGVGMPGFIFVFEDPSALTLARQACDEGLLPENICQRLF